MPGQKNCVRCGGGLAFLPSLFLPSQKLGPWPEDPNVTGFNIDENNEFMSID